MCSTSATLTLSSPADATALSSCNKYEGSVAIDSRTSDSTFTLDFVQQITGDLVAMDVGTLTSISAKALTTVGGIMYLEQLDSISTVDFPKLTTVGGINWQYLGPRFRFDIPGLTTASTIDISSTSLEAIEFSSLATVGSVSVNSNSYLVKLNLSCEYITKDLSITFNGNGQLDLSLPNVLQMSTASINNVYSLDLSSLKTVGDFFSIRNNKLARLAIPALTTSGHLDITGNSDLTELSLPQLNRCSENLTFKDNSAFLDDLSFPSLNSVLGGINLVGNFSSVSIPQIQHVGDAFTIWSSSSDVNSTCSQLSPLSASVVRGQVDCSFAGAPSVSSSASSSKSYSSSPDAQVASTTTTPSSTTFEISSTTSEVSSTTIGTGSTSTQPSSFNIAGFATSTTSTQSSTTTNAFTDDPSSHAEAIPIKRSDTAVIAGGTVGGVIAVVILLGFVYYFLRRKRRPRQEFSAPPSGSQVMEIQGTSRHELADSQRLAELADPRALPAELASR